MCDIIVDMRVLLWPTEWRDEAKRADQKICDQHHCVRVTNFALTIEALGVTKNVPGSGLV